MGVGVGVAVAVAVTVGDGVGVGVAVAVLVVEGVGVGEDVGVGVGIEATGTILRRYSFNLTFLSVLAAFSSPFATSILLPENSPVNLGDSSFITFVIKLPLGAPTVIV